MAATSVQRLAVRKGRAALVLPDLPRIAEAAPKMAKAFPDDMKRLQEVLDDWHARTESLLRESIDNVNGG